MMRTLREKQEHPSVEPYPRRSLRKKKTREKIIKATNKLVALIGASEITMNAVAEAADVHVTTLFTHFSTKTELFSALSEPSIARLERMVAESMGQVPFFEFAKEHAASLAILARRKRQPGINYDRELGNDLELMPAWLKYEQRQIDLYKKYIAREYGLDERVDKRPLMIAAMIVSTNIQTYGQSQCGRSGINFEQEARETIETVERLVGPGLLEPFPTPA